MTLFEVRLDAENWKTGNDKYRFKDYEFSCTLNCLVLSFWLPRQSETSLLQMFNGFLQHQIIKL
jgi:hypothetical protein